MRGSYLWDVDLAAAKLLELGLQVADLDTLGQVAHEEVHLCFSVWLAVYRASGSKFIINYNSAPKLSQARFCNTGFWGFGVLGFWV